MKRIIVFVVVGLVMFGAGFGGGLVLGRTMASGDGAAVETRQVGAPGPIVSVGEFTSNLAGAGRHVITFTLSLELLNEKAVEVVQAPGWLLRIKNEGALQFAGDIKRTLNSILPENKGEPLVVQALFESFVLQ